MQPGAVIKCRVQPGSISCQPAARENIRLNSLRAILPNLMPRGQRDFSGVRPATASETAWGTERSCGRHSAVGQGIIRRAKPGTFPE